MSRYGETALETKPDFDAQVLLDDATDFMRLYCRRGVAALLTGRFREGRAAQRVLRHLNVVEVADSLATYEEFKGHELVYSADISETPIDSAVCIAQTVLAIHGARPNTVNNAPASR